MGLLLLMCSSSAVHVCRHIPFVSCGKLKDAGHLAQGGMGEVRLARCWGHLVVRKSARKSPNKSECEWAQSILDREAVAMSAAQGEGVVQLVAIAREDSRYDFLIVSVCVTCILPSHLSSSDPAIQRCSSRPPTVSISF